MSLAAQDLRDLTEALRLHPEWRDEVRRLVLTEEVLRLPALFAELAAAQQRTEQRVEELAAAQRRTEEKLERLTVRVGELADAQTRTEARLAELVAVVQGVVDRLGRVEGDLLEFNYARKAGSYFGRLIRRARVVTFQDLEDQLRATLADVEVDEVLDLDLMVGGRLPTAEPPQDVLLAVEVSVTVDRGDVERASRRAEVLRRVVPLVIPVVAGKETTLGVEDHARELGVTILYDGKVRLWPDSVARWTQSPD